MLQTILLVLVQIYCRLVLIDVAGRYFDGDGVIPRGDCELDSDAFSMS